MVWKPKREGIIGSVATLRALTEHPRRAARLPVSGRQIEQLVDEPILLANISTADPAAPVPCESCASPRIPRSFGRLRETRESPAWPSRGV